LLILDEVQKIPGWSETVKHRWDTDTGIELHVLLLGSAPLLIQRGLTESLAGRFALVRAAQWSFAEMRAAFGWDLPRYIYFGGYPGAAPLIEDEERWATYVRDALIETTVSRDILLLLRIDKPALLRRLFGLGCAYPGRILSYNKMLGQLHDAGNTTTLARPDTTTALARARTASIGGVSSSRPSAPICFGPPRAPLPRSPGGETGTTRSTSCSAKARASSR